MNGLASKNVVITGATGFLGSTIAANILSFGGSVIAITRQDTSKRRTLIAIRNAASGCGLTINREDELRLTVIESSLNNLSDLDLCDKKLNDYTVWHCAAEMTYKSEMLEESLNTNLVKSQRIYQYFSTSTACQRFYYVSTAYTAGFNVNIANESLNLQPRLINPYQTSKWAAELSLSHASHGSELPVTVFRPSIICGHDKTGWHGDSNFGLYGVLAALKIATRLKDKTVEVDVNQQSQPNFIPINHVVKHALLLQSNGHHQKHFEIVHSVADKSLKLSQIAKIVSGLWHINIKMTKPVSNRSKWINESLKPNLPFLNHVWFFSQKVLPGIVHDQYVPYQMTVETMTNLISYYYLPESSAQKICSNG